jgi:signal transduction histidine kinase
MKLIACLLLTIVIGADLLTQPLPDSVRAVYNAATTAYAKHECLHFYLESIRSDSNFTAIADELQKYFLQKNDRASFDYVEITRIGMMSKTGNYVNALDKSLELVKIFKERKDPYGEVLALYRVGQALWYGGDIEQSHLYWLMQLPLALKLQNNRMLMLCYNALASDYAVMNKPDSGVWYGYKALHYASKVNTSSLAAPYGTLGENYIVKKDFDSAILVSRAGLDVSTDASNTSILYANLAQAFLGKQQYDSATHYANVLITFSRQNEFNNQLQLGYECLSRIYDQQENSDSAFKYLKLAGQTKDELYSSQKAKDINAINLREQARQQKAEQEKVEFKNRARMYALLGGLLAIFIIAFILLKSNRQKQRANIELQKQKEKVENTLTELRSTQQQLIQSEKMASLGELTAGIAHEIQNPLNFVNNFSDVNTELVDELRSELAIGNLQLAREIADNIKDNEQKINHHGKRADSIVKGMLQHSRTNSGQKESTDINALADEYLRLAYHGMKAKDPRDAAHKSFTVTTKTDFDNSIGKVNVVPQDLGRVILNLINNAFYAVSEKQKAQSLMPNAEGYEPTVTVSTTKRNGKVEIKVKDNGNGIPQKVLDKVFQPFFTTKPTGQGTGLGLSLAYDIVTKGHRGDLRVETKEGEGSEFIIQLPIQT